MSNGKITKLINYAVAKLNKKDKRLYDSNILNELREVTDEEIENILDIKKHTENER